MSTETIARSNGRLDPAMITSEPCGTPKAVVEALKTQAFDKRIIRFLGSVGVGVEYKKDNDAPHKSLFGALLGVRANSPKEFDEMLDSLFPKDSVVPKGLRMYLAEIDKIEAGRRGEGERDRVGEFNEIVRRHKGQYIIKTGSDESRATQFRKLFDGIPGVTVQPDRTPEPEATAEDWLSISKIISKENPEAVFCLPRLVESGADKLSVALAILANPTMAKDLVAGNMEVTKNYPEVLPLLEIEPIDVDLVDARKTVSMEYGVYDAGQEQVTRLRSGEMQIKNGDLKGAAETAGQIALGYILWARIAIAQNEINDKQTIDVLKGLLGSERKSSR